MKITQIVQHLLDELEGRLNLLVVTGKLMFRDVVDYCRADVLGQQPREPEHSFHLGWVNPGRRYDDLASYMSANAYRS